MQFQFTALAGGTSPLDITNPFLLDSGLNDITANATFQNGSVAIATTPEPHTYAGLCALLLLTLGTFRARQTRTHVQPLQTQGTPKQGEA